GRAAVEAVAPRRRGGVGVVTPRGRAAVEGVAPRGRGVRAVAPGGRRAVGVWGPSGRWATARRRAPEVARAPAAALGRPTRPGAAPARRRSLAGRGDRAFGRRSPRRIARVVLGGRIV